MPCYPVANYEPKLSDPENIWIAPNASVVGQVELDPFTSIWFGAVIRGDNDQILIGEGSNIQDNAVLHTDAGLKTFIGRNCSIGHAAIIHGCSIDDNCLIGMGAIVMNRSIIGKNCLIGAGSLITEGKTFPANSLIIGSPARVIRTLSDVEIETIGKIALEYQNKIMLYKHTIQ